MKETKISILGSIYKVLFGKRKDIKLNEEYLGECRSYSREIKVCTDVLDCREDELKVRNLEVISHEVFHAYINEAGIELDENVEEMLASFYQKNHLKMEDTISEISKAFDIKLKL